jgi:hypothetical protein
MAKSIKTQDGDDRRVPVINRWAFMVHRRNMFLLGISREVVKIQRISGQEDEFAFVADGFCS